MVFEYVRRGLDDAPHALAPISALTGTNLGDDYTDLDGTVIADRLPPTNNGSRYLAGPGADIQSNQMRLSTGADYAFLDQNTSDCDFQIDYNPGGAENKFWIYTAADFTILSDKPDDGYGVFLNIGGSPPSVALRRFLSGAELDLTLDVSNPLDLSNTAQTRRYRLRNDTETAKLQFFADGVLISQATDPNPTNSLARMVGVSMSTVVNDAGRFDLLNAKKTSQIYLASQLRYYQQRLRM